MPHPSCFGLSRFPFNCNPAFRASDLSCLGWQVRRIELSRTSASGSVAPELVSELLGTCELEGVAKLRCAEGMLPVWQPGLFARLNGLRVLNLSNCALPSLPAGAWKPPFVPAVPWQGTSLFLSTLSASYFCLPLAGQCSASCGLVRRAEQGCPCGCSDMHGCVAVLRNVGRWVCGLRADVQA